MSAAFFGPCRFPMNSNRSSTKPGGTDDPDRRGVAVLKGDNKMRVFQEEIFGPVLAVTTFKDQPESGPETATRP